MLDSSRFQLAGVKAVIFVAKGTAFSPQKVLGSVLNKYAARYDGQVQALPLPSNTPPEIPRVILQSKDQAWIFQASLNRVESVWARRASSPEEPTAVLEESVSVIEDYVKNSGTPVARLGLVISRFCEVSEPANSLISRFCSDEARNGPFSKAKEFHIDSYEQYSLSQLDELTINSWIRLRTGTTEKGDSRIPAVFVEQDLNTLEHKPGDDLFGANTVVEFFKVAFEEAGSILKVYFPVVS